MALQIPSWLDVRGEDVHVNVLVVPRASRSRIMGVHDDRLKIQITAPPVEGQANEALRRLLSKLLDIPRAQIEVVGGASGRRKTVRLARVAAHHVLLRLSPHKNY